MLDHNCTRQWSCKLFLKLMTMNPNLPSRIARNEFYLSCTLYIFFLYSWIVKYNQIDSFALFFQKLMTNILYAGAFLIRYRRRLVPNMRKKKYTITGIFWQPELVTQKICWQWRKKIKEGEKLTFPNKICTLFIFLQKWSWEKSTSHSTPDAVHGLISHILQRLRWALLEIHYNPHTHYQPSR